MNRSSIILASLCIGGGLSVFGAAQASAALSPVFEYTFPASSSDLSSGTVTDVSGAGHDGTATLFPSTGLSSNVPAGKSGLSADYTSGGDQSITTSATQLLTSSAIASAGGFTYDVYFNAATLPSLGFLYKIIDYAGTDNLALTSESTLRFTFDDNGGGAVFSAPITTGTWHHVVAAFDTTGNSLNAGAITGSFTLTVDGVSTLPTTQTKGTFGDSLNRVIGVGSHPGGGENFDGLLYDPTVSLGVASVPEPASIAVLAATPLFMRRRRHKHVS